MVRMRKTGDSKMGRHELDAETIRNGRLIVLCGQAIELTMAGNRTTEEIVALIKALQIFKNAPSARKTQLDLRGRKTDPEYPGRDGSKCLGCGGWIDEGGMCQCGADHGSIYGR